MNESFRLSIHQLTLPYPTLKCNLLVKYDLFAGLLSEGLALVLHHSGLLHLLTSAETLPVQVPGELGIRQEESISWHRTGKFVCHRQEEEPDQADTPLFETHIGLVGIELVLVPVWLQQ